MGVPVVWNKIMWIRVFWWRLSARVKNCFRIREMWTWKYESCRRCGSCYRVPIGWVEEAWLGVNDISDGCLCADCFITIAQQRNFKLLHSDIECMWFFDPDGAIGGCIDIIKSTGIHYRIRPGTP